MTLDLHIYNYAIYRFLLKTKVPNAEYLFYNIECPFCTNALNEENQVTMHVHASVDASHCIPPTPQQNDMVH